MDQFWRLVGPRSIAVASAFLLVTGVSVLWVFSSLYVTGLSTIPLIGDELGNAEQRRKGFISHAQKLYNMGYAKFKNRTWRLTGTDGDRIILPRHLLDDVGRMPDSHISIEKAIEKSNEIRYTGLGGTQGETEFLIHLIRSDLTHALNRINPRLEEEIAHATVEELGPCEDWTRAVIYQKMLRIVAVASGNIFIGPDLCRSEEWIVPAITYTVDLFTAIGKLKQWRWWTRPIGQYFIPEIESLHQHRRKAVEWLEPVVAKRRQMMEKKGYEAPDDMLQWMMNKGHEFNVSDNSLALIQLNLSLAAIHTTTLTTTLVLYDIVAQPGLVQELRNEVRTAMANHGDKLTTRALHDMRLLDSVMKESQRTNPVNLVRFIRIVEKPVTLSDGTYLPPGTHIESAHASILQDRNLYSNPETFDGHRFLNLRSGATPDPLQYKNKEQYQFVTATKDFMSFGYGRHACPGRFFAGNEIKLILARILVDYDFKMPDGLTERYANLNTGLDSLPDPTKALLFKRLNS
ncbi:hypothetical protein JX265_009825 [Neoarthrinium moseri]|uniref:Uncharacterized protein n=1 Tax=Neoarthrinium moseri TaxID=1658444 RepID=A0A9P9WFC1_9PEZI|nr:uncharacterized protein JN550_005422 [Neoarthrinium moseri]KAI1860426.1 hypothetical protein JX265_009825 [Neoarthrinium moseri]KAI1869832.1 hypothetical protein JN550_005422 [Neoarthrinium moseri]